MKQCVAAANYIKILLIRTYLLIGKVIQLLAYAQSQLLLRLIMVPQENVGNKDLFTAVLFNKFGQ